MAKVKLTGDQRELAAGAVSSELERGGERGVAIGDIKNLITRTLHLGAFPKSEFGKILFKAKTKRVGDRYFAMGAGPKKEKRIKENGSNHIAADSKQLTLEGDLTVTVKGSGYNFKSSARKIIIIVSILTGLFLILKPF